MGDQKKKAQRGASEVSMPREIVHLYSFTNYTMNSIWYNTSCVAVVYIWDSSFSIATVGAMASIRNMVGPFV